MSVIIDGVTHVEFPASMVGVNSTACGLQVRKETKCALDTNCMACITAMADPTTQWIITSGAVMFKYFEGGAESASENGSESASENGSESEE